MSVEPPAGQVSAQESVPAPSNTAFDAVLSWASQISIVLLRAKKRVAGLVLAGGIVGAGIAVQIPNQYTSAATFITQSSTSLGLPAALQGAVASLGLEKGADYSPKFYADLLTSRPILQSAVVHRYHIPTGDSTRLESYLAIGGFTEGPPNLALESAIGDLASRVSASADVRTNMITLTVRASQPYLSHDIASQLLTALDSLNVGFRQNQSRASREFYETRVLQTRRELDSAETVVRNFLQKNRVITSPALQFEFQRLQREAERKQTLYAIVVQQYEQARMQEARNVPTLTILSPPFVPVEKSYPPRRFFVFLGAFAGLLIAWGQIAIADGLSRLRKEQPARWEALQEQLRRVRRLGHGAQ